MNETETEQERRVGREGKKSEIRAIMEVGEKGNNSGYELPEPTEQINLASSGIFY